MGEETFKAKEKQINLGELRYSGPKGSDYDSTGAIEEFDNFRAALMKYVESRGPVTLMNNGTIHTDYITDNVKDIINITNRMVELYSRKNRDYGNTFDQTLDDDGLIVAKIRLRDKMGRFSQLINQEATVNDESIIDTLIDLANYAVMTIRWIESRSYDG